MTDILLIAYLTAMASDDLDTAREVASLASDPDAVDAMLADVGDVANADDTDAR